MDNLKIENAKNSGLIENIKKEWKEKFGTDDPKEIKEKLQEMKEEFEKSDARKNKLYNDLLNAYDWDELEEELE